MAVQKSQRYPSIEDFVPRIREQDVKKFSEPNYSSTATYTRYSEKEWADAYEKRHSWHQCTDASLRGHIVNAHFQAMTLADMGVAAYDIELALWRGMRLDWVVKKACERLERNDKDIQTEICKQGVANKLTVIGYRQMLVRNLKFIELLELGKIDWDRVNRSFKGASEIQLDMRTDTKDFSFFAEELLILKLEGRGSIFGGVVLEDSEGRMKSILEIKQELDRIRSHAPVYLKSHGVLLRAGAQSIR